MLFFIFFILFVLYCKNDSIDLEIPLYKSIDNYKYNLSNGKKCISYDLDIEFPAEQLIAFYDNYFKSNNFIISEALFPKKWSSVYKRNEKYIQHLCKNWIREDKKYFSLFCVMYYGYDFKNIDYYNAEVIVCIYNYDKKAEKMFDEYEVIEKTVSGTNK